jgi:ribosome-binding protein aMBF1 (putative translation factor)
MMMSDCMLILERERRSRGWSRSELGRRARLDGSLLAKIEGGRIKPYEGQLRRIAAALRWPARDGTGLLDKVPTDAAVAE